MFDIPTLIQTIGLVGIIAIIYAESGLLIGLFLPGDSLLFTAGLLASQGYLNFPLLLIGAGAAAILGDSTGYWFGVKIGPRIFTRDDSWLFHKDHVTRTKKFFDKYGVKTIILARFIPIVRTFAPILAGVGGMNYKVFLRNNVIGAIIWAIGIPTLGYGLGQAIPEVDRYLLPIIVIIVLTSFIPPFFEVIKKRSSRD